MAPVRTLIRPTDVGDEVAASIRATGGQVIFLATDSAMETDVAELIRTAVTEFVRLDGAFNNVGGVNTLVTRRHRTRIWTRT